VTNSGTDAGGRTLRIQWVRSGIGFHRRQREIVRGLGLRRLHQVVERPDTPQVRGMVAAIPHLVRIVSGSASSSRIEIPEYTCLPPEAVAKPAPEVTTPAASVELPAPAEAPEAQEIPAAGSDSTPTKVEDSPAKAKPAKAKKVEKAEKKKGTKPAAKETRAGAGKAAKSPKGSKK
jgi:large subunit ribosomal protein L30